MGDGPASAKALSAMRQTWADLQAAKQYATGINRKVDQYEVNAARRVSIAEGIAGNRRAGLAIGARAVHLAVWSESPRLDTSTPELTVPQRMKVKAKALLGGVAALSVNIINFPASERRHKVATRLASKAL